jgi:hypothetical protein
MTKQVSQLRGVKLPDELSGFKFTGGIDPLDNPFVIGEIVSRLLLFAMVISGLIFFFRLIIAGFSYMTSGGDPGKLQTASKSLLNAAIGLFVVITSYFLIQIIELLFGIRIVA